MPASTADAGRTALPNLARQFDLMAKGCRSMNLGSWEDHFFRLYEEARDGKISAEEIAETIDYDYRNENDGKAAATQIITSLIADADKSALIAAAEAFSAAAYEVRDLLNSKGIACPSSIMLAAEKARAALAAAKGAK